MKLPYYPLSLLVVLVCLLSGAHGQQRNSGRANTRESGSSAIVIVETLSMLRAKPGLYADPIKRIRRGRRVRILTAAEADGVKFYKVAASPASVGWIQSEAIFGKFRPTDEERFARLVQAVNGFDQIQLAAMFLEMYPASKFRPAVLLLVGDLLEDAAAKLSRDANSRLSRREMAATGAPIHSYYLNFSMLDRYRRLGARFLFDSSTRSFHYDGACWKEIIRKYPESAELGEARKRLDSLAAKLDKRGE